MVEYKADCPFRVVLERVCSKWTLLVLFILRDTGTLRFNALRRLIPDVSQKMLVRALRILEEDGYIERSVYGEVPPRVEYTLTELGLSLAECFSPVVAWAEGHLAVILKNRGDKGVMGMPDMGK